MNRLIRLKTPTVTLDSRHPRVMLVTIEGETYSMTRDMAERFGISVLATAQSGFMEPEVPNEQCGLAPAPTPRLAAEPSPAHPEDDPMFDHEFIELGGEG